MKIPEDRTELAIALGQHYGRWDFDHFATLTFDEEVDGDFAIREVKRWIRRVEKLGNGKAWWVATAEVGDQGRLHAHVLTANTAGLPNFSLAAKWHLGRPDIEPCRNSQNAASYITKYAGTPRMVEHDAVLPLLCAVPEFQSF